MSTFLNLLRDASILSIFVLLALVLVLLIFRGRIKDHDLQIFAYVWLPIAAITQFLMTYYRLSIGKSNLPIANIYFIIEFLLLVLILLRIRKKRKGIEPNYMVWSIVVLGGVLIHFLYELDSLHIAAILYASIVYFNITVSFIDLEKTTLLLKDPFALLNIGVFMKAFGYSYISIYQIDLNFPLYIHTAVNLLVQVVFSITIFVYYLEMKRENKYL